MDELLDRQIDGWIYGQRNGWMDREIVGWIGRQGNGWMDRQIVRQNP